MEHTKGPWAWQKFGDTYSLTAQHGMREIIISANPSRNSVQPIVVMNLDGRLQPVNPEHPNAQLIAKAPELLEALKELLHEYTTTDFDVVWLNPKLIEKCRELISK